MKNTFLIAAIFLVCITEFTAVNSAGECGTQSPDQVAYSLAPCVPAAKDKTAPVSASCCNVITQIGQNPRCLCAVMLSNTAQSIGAKPEISITIPKRCNIANRPVGYKCGAYTLP